MVRVLRKRTMLLISLIVSLFIFFAGFILGYGLDKARISDVVKEIDAIEFDRDSYITEQSFVELFGGDKCASINTRLRKFALIPGSALSRSRCSAQSVLSVTLLNTRASTSVKK